MVASELEQRWPTTLRGWDEVEKEQDEAVSRILHRPWDEDPLGALRMRRLPEPASSILLARECHVPAIIPLAFFNLMAWPSFPPHGYYEDEIDVFKNIPRRDLVSPEDWRRLFEARELIARWCWLNAYIDWEPQCADTACRKTASTTLSRIADDIGPTGDFLRSSRYSVDRSNDVRDICPACRKKLQDHIRKLRCDFVDQLKKGAFFG